MKNISTILESQNITEASNWQSYGSEPIIDGEYIVLVDCGSFGSRVKSQDVIRCSLKEVEEHIKDWAWEFNNYWVNEADEMQSRKILGMDRHELINYFYEDEMTELIHEFVSKQVKQLKPWESAQFVVDFPYCEILAVSVYRTARTGITAK